MGKPFRNIREGFFCFQAKNQNLLEIDFRKLQKPDFELFTLFLLKKRANF